LHDSREEKLRSLLFFLGALLVLGVAGCGEKKTGEEPAATTAQETQEAPSAASQLPPADVTAKPGTEVGTEPVTMPLAGLYIRPFFDAKGTVTELSVAVGGKFSVGVWAETVAPYQTNAAQYRLELPAGVRVTSTQELAAKSVSMGNYATNFQIAYDCQPSGRFLIVEYLCVADPEFKGGEVKVNPGFDAQGSPYLGFSTCDFVLAPSEGGSAMLKK
jgi:hypothetical protein